MRELTPELRALHDLARAASEGTHDVDMLLRAICESVAETFGFDRVSVTRYSPETRMMTPLVAHGVPDDPTRPPMPIETQPLLGHALEARTAVFVRDVGIDPALSPEIIETLGLRSVLAVPLISSGECIGFLTADRGGTVFELPQATLDLLTAIGAMVAVLVAQAFERSELVRLDELKSEFIALASHELRTPTAVIHGIATTLNERGDDLGRDQRYQLQRALVEQTDRLRRLVDQLLDLSRLEADAIKIDPEPFRVRRRVEEVLLTHAGPRAQDVRIDVPPQLEAVADPNVFERIVANLVTNAFKYGAPPVIVSAQQSDRHLRVAVEDRGRGVEPQFVPELFQRFTRSDLSATETYGAGLGLSIAQSYAEAHGGGIFYREAEPHGAHFEVVLPLRE
ncbi:MAG: ATP-binding protein [Actinomycetota bacterium]|nr:ATP-binding protein [Actinomycetota bacterium]